jgi:hypothetical protein
MKVMAFALATLCAALVAPAALAEVHLNEIGINDTGADNEEFIELVGTPGESLDNVMVLIVEGDGTSSFGTLDRAFNLTGNTIPLDGYFVLGGSGIATADFALANDSIENGSNTVYLLAATSPAAVTALVGTNLITGIGTTSIPTLGTIIDSFGVLSEDVFNPAELDTIFDGATQIAGADQKFESPTGMLRGGDYPGTWCGNFSGFDLTQGRTPGAANQACSAVNLTFPAATCIATNGNAAGWGLRLQVYGDFTSTGTTTVELFDATTDDGNGHGIYILAAGSTGSTNLPLGCKLLATDPGLNFIGIGGITNTETDGTGSFAFNVVAPGGTGSVTLQAFVTTDNGLGYSASNGVEVTIAP